MQVRSKLNSIESAISKALIVNEISNEDFTTVINEKRDYRELKGSIKTMKSQKSDLERNKLIEDGKRINIGELLDRMRKLIII